MGFSWIQLVAIGRYVFKDTDRLGCEVNSSWILMVAIGTKVLLLLL